MDLFTYVLKDDSGYAPNPFGDRCTLATCKPRIRATAQVGDWIAGLGSTRAVGSGRLVYAMLVDEVVPLDIYGSAPRFVGKRPSVQGDWWQRLGDNQYFKDSTGGWRQRRGRHGPRQMERDLSGLKALVGAEYYYFGREAPELPPELRQIIKRGPGYRRIRSGDVVRLLATWLRASHRTGLLGDPWARRTPDDRVRGGRER